jgi:hypothetical protein
MDIIKIKRFCMGTFRVSSGKATSCVPLNGFISELLASFQSLAEKQRNKIVNDISPDLFVRTNTSLLSRAISGLISEIVPQCENSCIRLSAKSFHNVVLLRITNISGSQSIHAIENIEEISRLAESLGGCVTYNNQHLNETSFVLSFFDFPTEEHREVKKTYH